MNYIAILALFAITTISCCHTKVIQTDNRDSIRIEVRERIDTVRDTVTFEIEREVEKIVTFDSTSFLENKVASSTAIVSGGLLSHSLESKPQSVSKEVVYEVVVKDSIVYRDREITNVVEVERDLTWWQKFRMNGFWVLLFIVCIFVSFKIGKIW